MHTTRHFLPATALLTLALVLCLALGARADNHLVVRGDYNYPPFEFLENGVPTGFSVDVMRAVAKATGLKIKIDLGPWPEVREQLERGEIAAVMGMHASPKRDLAVDFSTPFYLTSHSLFVRHGSKIAGTRDIAGHSLIVQDSDIMHEYAQDRFPEARLALVSSPGEALTFLSSGRHDAALLGTYQGRYLIKKYGLTNIDIAGEPIEPLRYCIAVPEGHGGLLAHFNEGLAMIKLSGEFDAIRDKWFGVYEDKALARHLLRHWPYVVAPLSLLLAATLLWTWTLRRKVREKTEALEKEFGERLDAERALDDNRKRFQEMVGNSPLGTTIVNREGKPLLMNKAMEELCGYGLEEITDIQSWGDRAYPSKRYRAMVEDRWWSAVEKLYAGEAEPPPAVIKIRCKDGTVKDVEYRLGLIGEDIMILAMDVTERLRTEEALVQTEKMISLGGMASGMAHEINNPLGGILQGIQNVVRRITPGLPANERAAREAGVDMERMRAYMQSRGIDSMLEGIRASGERVAEVVTDMLSFSSSSGSQRAPCDLAALVDRALEMVAAEYRMTSRQDFTAIEIRRNYDPDLPEVPCTETEILQVFMNVLRNAAQAMAGGREGGDPPRIGITLRQEEGMAVAEFEDNGPGMRESVRKRVFEPFFTTKEPGVGTGLGLSVSYFIVTRNHHGTFEVWSAPNQGAVFTVALPLGTD
ncbi:transporter substrate-binding domain-containing protein [Desulfocurvus sp. DL9XJH121]